MNAIILAAGLGSRFGEVTKKVHKALLPINGLPNIENTINYLIEAGISDIHIVTGHLSEQFEYLKEKYNCNLIFNNKYRKYNNIYSFYCASDFLNNSYIIDADVVLFKNIFTYPPKKSSYFLIKRPFNASKYEWVPIINNDRISKIDVSNIHDYSLLGISFWVKDDLIRIKKELKKFLIDDVLLDSRLYWDNIPMSLLKDLDIGFKKLDIQEAYEIDNIEEYNFISNKNL